MHVAPPRHAAPARHRDLHRLPGLLQRPRRGGAPHRLRRPHHHRVGRLQSRAELPGHPDHLPRRRSGRLRRAALFRERLRPPYERCLQRHGASRFLRLRLRVLPAPDERLSQARRHVDILVLLQHAWEPLRPLPLLQDERGVVRRHRLLRHGLQELGRRRHGRGEGDLPGRLPGRPHAARLHGRQRHQEVVRAHHGRQRRRGRRLRHRLALRARDRFAGLHGPDDGHDARRLLRLAVRRARGHRLRVGRLPPRPDGRRDVGGGRDGRRRARLHARRRRCRRLPRDLAVARGGLPADRPRAGVGPLHRRRIRHGAHGPVAHRRLLRVEHGRDSHGHARRRTPLRAVVRRRPGGAGRLRDHPPHDGPHTDRRPLRRTRVDLLRNREDRHGRLLGSQRLRFGQCLHNPLDQHHVRRLRLP